jgi:hypothetical protein
MLIEMYPVEMNEGIVTLEQECVMCGQLVVFDVDRTGYEKRLAGDLIQRCFPTLDPKFREMLVSGTCPDCWEKMFGKEGD